VLESLLALRLAEEALEIRQRRLLVRDQRLALWVEIAVRTGLTVACLTVASGALPH